MGGSRRVATEVDSSIFAEGFCFLAAPKRGERPHQRQSEPNFSLRLLASQLSSSQLSCANHSDTPAMSIGKSPSRWISDGQIFHEFSTVVCRPDDNPHVPLPLPARQRSKLGASFAAPLATKPCDLEGERERRLIGGEGPYQREIRRVARSRTSQMLPELDARAWCRCEELHGQASRELTLRRR